MQSLRVVLQKYSKVFAQLIGKLTEAVQRQVKGKEKQEYLIRQQAFENANDNCQSILRPIRKKEHVMELMKACPKCDSISHQAGVNALEAYFSPDAS